MRNEEIVRRCERLKGYSRFIAKVRELAVESHDLESAMAGAVRWCITNGVLRGFFEMHGTEVVNMLMMEWKLEDALVVEREEGREEGLQKGREEGLQKGREQGLQKGREQGREESIISLLEFGMNPEQISRALKLPFDVVQQYVNEE